jgi:hypothetical protein
MSDDPSRINAITKLRGCSMMKTTWEESLG